MTGPCLSDSDEMAGLTLTAFLPPFKCYCLPCLQLTNNGTLIGRIILKCAYYNASQCAVNVTRRDEVITSSTIVLLVVGAVSKSIWRPATLTPVEPTLLKRPSWKLVGLTIFGIREEGQVSYLNRFGFCLGDGVKKNHFWGPRNPKSCFHARMCLWGVLLILDHLCVSREQNHPILRDPAPERSNATNNSKTVRDTAKVCINHK